MIRPRLCRILLASLGWVLLEQTLASAEPPKAVITRQVWTSEQVEQLRARGLISVVGREPSAEPAAPVPAPYVREKDPEWYREQVAALRAQIEFYDQQSRMFRTFRANATGMTGGIRLDQENIGITPESSVWLLQNASRDALTRLGALEEQARRNGIPPGALR